MKQPLTPRTAYAEGRLARQAKIPRQDNPYQGYAGHELLADMWDKGWITLPDFPTEETPAP